MHYENSLEFAISLDHYDKLAQFRNEFLFPQHDGKPAIYFTGNSLGLQPTKAREYILQELNDWEKYGVEGHFHAKNPWFSYHEPFKDLLAPVVGAKPSEVVAMGTLTNNVHLLMISFYKPTKTRFKIISEAKAFPSDLYALDSQAKLHGFDPKDAIVELFPREGETFLRTEDILQKIEECGDELALIMMGGVNYYTGQFFDLEKITKKAHEVGAYAGFDLAHAAGNVELKLHDWNIDFAAWCSYKYLNSGPGSIAGIYVHEKHHLSDLPRLQGWWGNASKNRFKMERNFISSGTAESWQLSNAPVFSMAVHRASLELFNQAGMKNLVDKSKKLTGYLLYLINEINAQAKEEILKVLTPPDESDRGCQVSIVVKQNGKALFEAISKKGVIADWREPDVIRIAPVPLYNSFKDVYDFYVILKQICVS